MEFKDYHYANGDTSILEWDWSTFDWLDFFGNHIMRCGWSIVTNFIIFNFLIF